MNVFCAGVILIKCAVGAIGLIMFAYYNDCDPVRAGVRHICPQSQPIAMPIVILHVYTNCYLINSCCPSQTN